MRQPLASGRFDAVEALAFPVAVTVLSELLGVPVEDRHEIRPRALALGTAFVAFVPNEDRPTANAAVVWFRDYMERLIERRRREPGSDLISAMVTDPEAADIEVETLIDNAFFLCFSGFETTVNLISSGCALLAAHQDQLARLRANPSLVLSAVDEFLRFDAPIQSTGRIVRESLEIDGRLLRRGRLVTLLLGSANHDERQFADPGRLDITRSPNHHVSFGAGIHHCLGAALSRVEGVAVFSRLLQICDRFDANGSPLRTRSALFRGYAHVPVAVSPSRAMADGTVTAP
jgi:cytochrome P450